ncbi:hypothetical protein BHS00_05425 [Lactococcus carnosus]|nr:hypothetical protein BHS00_05425 [Lactococcus carnosus]
MAIGLILFVLSIYGLNKSYKLFLQVKNRGNETTPPFIMLALWSSLVFYITLLGVAIANIFKLI